MRTVLFILDFDGTIIPSSRIEKLCRRIFKKIGLSRPPNICLALSEIVDFFGFLFKIKKVVAHKNIHNLVKENNFPIGILTDRSLFSLCQYLEVLGIDIKNLAFVQTRKSLLNFFIYSEKEVFVSQKTKPDKEVFENLLCFVKKNGLKKNNVVFVDDLAEARALAKNFGLQAMDPIDLPA
ncbi:MAG: hypothetical protein KGJ58_00765 [Patescibacteria group bacterium]|nr:hypothetical protein [Patescibacteria group bacterium]MDE1988155.1 hypothetical protein [Patescibacteria group bacterium]MDE2217975.1 hypothetical protein [Patescibacteria group bacterium]